MPTVSDEHRQFCYPRLRHIDFEFTEQTATDSLAAVALVDNEENHPALFVSNATHRAADDRIAFVSNNGVIFVARRQDLGK